jgi:hypothetical protein
MPSCIAALRTAGIASRCRGSLPRLRRRSDARQLSFKQFHELLEREAHVRPVLAAAQKRARIADVMLTEYVVAQLCGYADNPVRKRRFFARVAA